MTLPSELVSLAVRGTSQDSTQGYLQRVDTMLRLCGVQSFQNQAGYIPLHDNKALQAPCFTEVSAHVARQNLMQLRIILTEHPPLLQEWIQAVCAVAKTLPDEYIPYFLDLGCRHPQLQKWFKLIMSDKAAWLIEQHQIDNWAWYQKCDAISVEEVIAQQNQDNRLRIYDINVSLAHDPLHWANHKGLNFLRNYSSMWREQTARLLIHAMFVANVTASFSEDRLIVEVIRKAAYHLPLNYTESLLTELRNGAEQWQALADELETIFSMRYDILSSILESD